MTVDLESLLDNIYHLVTHAGFTVADIDQFSWREFQKYSEMTVEKIKSENEIEKAKFKSISSMFASLFRGLHR